MVRAFLAALVLVAASASAAPAQEAEPTGLHEAVARIAKERDRAQACINGYLEATQTGVIQPGQGAFAYANAKGEMDSVINALISAVDKGEETMTKPQLVGQVRQASGGLDSFCAMASQGIPAGTVTTQGPWAQADVTDSLINAVETLYLGYRAVDRTARDTIKTQLEAAVWPALP